MKLLHYILLCPIIAKATGMAVGLDSLYLQNQSATMAQVRIVNLEESVSFFKVAARSVCKVPGPIMFLPYTEENDNFVIKVMVNHNNNPVVIDKFGLLTLAQDALIKVPYSGMVKYYGLYGYCGNKLGQSKFLKVLPSAASSAAPNFLLANCAQRSNFVYTINDKYIKVAHKQKQMNFSQVPLCQLSTEIMDKQGHVIDTEPSIFDAFSR